MGPNAGVAAVVHRGELSLQHEGVGASPWNGVHFQRDRDFRAVVRGRGVFEHQHIRAGRAVIGRNVQFRAGQVLHRQGLRVRDAVSSVVCGGPSALQGVTACAVSRDFRFHQLHIGHAAVVDRLKHVGCGHGGTFSHAVERQVANKHRGLGVADGDGLDARRAVAARIHGREFTAHHVRLVSLDGVCHHHQFSTWTVVREHRVRQRVRVAAFCAVARRNAERWCGVVLHFNDLLRGAFVATVVCGREGANNGEGVGTCVEAGDGVHLHGDVRDGASVCGCRVVVHNFLVAFDGEACGNGQLGSGVVHEQHALLVLRHVATFVDRRVESEVASSGLHTSAADFVVHPRQGHVAANVFHRDVGRVHVEFGAFKLQLEVSLKTRGGGVFNDKVARERGAVSTGVGGGEDHRAASGGGAGGHKFAFLVAPDRHAARIRSGGAGMVVQPGLVLGQVARPVAFHRRVHGTLDDRGSGVDDLNGLGLWARAVAAVV